MADQVARLECNCTRLHVIFSLKVLEIPNAHQTVRNEKLAVDSMQPASSGSNCLPGVPLLRRQNHSRQVGSSCSIAACKGF